MNHSKLALAAMLLLFLMLWAPLKQYEFFVENWMKVGAYAAPILVGPRHYGCGFVSC